jgi:hypothetical protein
LSRNAFSGGIVAPRLFERRQDVVDVAAHAAVVDIVEVDAQRKAGDPAIGGDVACGIEGEPDRRQRLGQHDRVRGDEGEAVDLAVRREESAGERQRVEIARDVQLRRIAVGEDVLADRQQQARRGGAVDDRPLVEACECRPAHERARGGAGDRLEQLHRRQVRPGEIEGQRGRCRTGRARLNERQESRVLGLGVVERRVHAPAVALEIRADRVDIIARAIVAEIERGAHRHADEITAGQVARARKGAVQPQLILVALLVVLELGVDRLRIGANAAFGRELGPGEQAVVLADQPILPDVELGRAELRVRRAGRLVIEPDLAIVGHLIAAIMRAADDEADDVVRPGGADRGLALLSAAQIHPAIAGIADQAESALVHRREGLEVDRCHDRFGLDVGRQRLVDRDRAEQHRRDRVEAERPRLATLVRADDGHAVEADRRPAIGRAAHLDIAFLPLVALDGDGRQAGERRGAVLVGIAAHRVGRDDVDQIVRIALGLDRGELGFHDRAGDDDLGVRIGVDRRELLRLRRRRITNQHQAQENPR